MNPEQFKDSWDQLKGSLKKEWRKFTDDDLLRIGGNQEEFYATSEVHYGILKGEISRWADRWYATVGQMV